MTTQLRTRRSWMFIDYNEVVELIAPGQDEGGPERWGAMQWGGTAEEMPMWQAVRIVIVDWAGSHRQLDAQIVSTQGNSLMDLAAIQATYDRDDFPVKPDLVRSDA